ncbi:MAG: rod shape-determining protein MreC [Phycisphaerae bacterium]
MSAAAYEALVREKTALENENASLALRVVELEGEVSLLTATRLWGGRDERIGARGRLIPARVIADDIFPWRTSRLVNVGSLQGVGRGAAVTSQFFGIDRGTEDGLHDGMAILLAEVLVGIVEQVGTNTARVKLLSDVTVELKVRVGRFADGEFVAVDHFLWLTGRGDGTMEIREVDRHDVETGAIQVGDVVLSDPSDDMLPAPMTIGKIVAIEPDHQNPLLSTLRVVSSVPQQALRKVYVFDPEGDMPE